MRKSPLLILSSFSIQSIQYFSLAIAELKLTCVFYGMLQHLFIIWKQPFAFFAKPWKSNWAFQCFFQLIYQWCILYPPERIDEIKGSISKDASQVSECFVTNNINAVNEEFCEWLWCRKGVKLSEVPIFKRKTYQADICEIHRIFHCPWIWWRLDLTI